MKTALLLIDIQNDYFPKGKMELEGSLEASLRAKEALAFFRKMGWPVIHIQHVSNYPGATFFLPNTEGVKIQENVQPLPGEMVIEKHYPNSFRETPLLDQLKQAQIRRLVICCMQTHMCVDASTRAAFDYGFKCIVLHDACATRNLSFQDKLIPAEQVHGAFLAALGSVYAKVMSVEEFLAKGVQK
jgi:nicotinamidase-related amidase